jgi:hypothetical protein
MPNATMAVVTSEEEWDEETRGKAMRLAEFEAGLCHCGCGQPAAEAHDATKGPWVVDETVCQAGRAMERVRRHKRKQAEARKAPEGWDDGMQLFPRRPTEKELAEAPALDRPSPVDREPGGRLERVKRQRVRGARNRGH